MHNLVVNKRLTKNFIDLGYTFWKQKKLSPQEDREFNYYGNSKILIVLDTLKSKQGLDITRFFISLGVCSRSYNDPIVRVKREFLPVTPLNLIIFSKYPDQIKDAYIDIFQMISFYTSSDELFSSPKNKRKLVSLFNE